MSTIPITASCKRLSQAVFVPPLLRRPPDRASSPATNNHLGEND
jgi:hypothetical protein